MSNLLLSLISICMVVDRWQPQCLPARPATFGYVDRTGKEVIPPKYANALKFKKGYARCTKFGDKGEIFGRKEIFIDKSGNEFEPDRQDPIVAADGAETVTIGAKSFTTEVYREIVSERNGLKLARDSYYFWVIDKAGKRFNTSKDNLHFTAVKPESGNWFCVRDGKTFEFTGRGQLGEIPGIEPAEPSKFYNRQTGTASSTSLDYDFFGPYSDGMISAWSRKDGWSFLDKDGKVRIKLPAECCFVQPFSEGLAAVAVGGKSWGPQNRRLDPCTKNGAKFGFIDKTGKFVIPPTFPCPMQNWKTEFKNGLALATVEKNASTAYGYINKRGKFVVPAKYSELKEFSDGLAAFNSREPGFDELASRYRFVSYRIIEQFLRQYDIFSMNRSQVVKLLGEPHSVKERPRAERYLLQQSCFGSMYFNIRYRADGLVYGYSVSNGDWTYPDNQAPPSDWIVQTQRPDVDEDLYEFFTRATKVAYPPIDGTTETQ